MGMPRDELMDHLTEAFPEAEITLTDLAGDNDHWQAEIVSSQFAGLSRVNSTRWSMLPSRVKWAVNCTPSLSRHGRPELQSRD